MLFSQRFGYAVHALCYTAKKRSGALTTLPELAAWMRTLWPSCSETYLSAVVLSTLVVFLLQMAVTILLGFLLFDADAPVTWVGLVIALLLGVAAFAGMGFGIAALIRSDEGASAVVNLIVLPMAFLSGSFGSTNDYPEVLQKIAEVLPLTYLLRLTKQAYLHGEYLTSDLTAVAVLAAWGIAGYVVAAKRFSWQPRQK